MCSLGVLDVHRSVDILLDPSAPQGYVGRKWREEEDDGIVALCKELSVESEATVSFLLKMRELLRLNLFNEVLNPFH